MQVVNRPQHTAPKVSGGGGGSGGGRTIKESRNRCTVVAGREREGYVARGGGGTFVSLRDFNTVEMREAQFMFPGWPNLVAGRVKQRGGKQVGPEKERNLSRRGCRFE